LHTHPAYLGAPAKKLKGALTKKGDSEMAEKKQKGGKVVSIKEKIQEKIQVLKKEVMEKKKASEKPIGDKDLRDVHKTLKRLQRKLSRMTALEKRAEARASSAPEEKTSDAAGAEPAEAGTEKAAG